MNTFFKLFPYIIQGVITIEQVVVAPGPVKKQILLDSILQVAQFMGTSDNETMHKVGILIDSLVTSFNKSGFFKTTPVPVVGSVTTTVTTVK